MNKTDIQIFLPVKDELDLNKTFTCGQCFRWREEPDGAYTGIALGMAARVRAVEGGLHLECTERDCRSQWADYFDLSRNYREARERVSIDSYMRTAAEFGSGIRILNQDRWETLCSFILSQCSNIPRIKKMVESLCKCFGEPRTLLGETLYTFPEPEKLAALDERDLAPLRLGYRAKYVLSAARAVSSGTLDLTALSQTDRVTAKRALMSLPGVGEKVADCALLFSLRIPDAFPIDVWVRRALHEQYPQGLDTSIFGENAGLAQQYIFYYRRSLG